MAEQSNSQDNYFNELSIRLRDLEERQRLLKDRLLLIGQNLVDLREKQSEEMIEVKKDIETIKRNVSRVVSFLEMASSEMSKFAKKEDLELLSKQAKMFQPLELKRKKI